MASESLFVYDLHLLAKHFVPKTLFFTCSHGTHALSSGGLRFRSGKYLPRHNTCDEHHQYDKIEQ